MYEDFPGFFTKMKILEGVRGRFLSAGHYEGGVAPTALGIVLVVFLFPALTGWANVCRAYGARDCSCCLSFPALTGWANICRASGATRGDLKNGPGDPNTTKATADVSV